MEFYLHRFGSSMETTLALARVEALGLAEHVRVGNQNISATSLLKHPLAHRLAVGIFQTNPIDFHLAGARAWIETDVCE